MARLLSLPSELLNEIIEACPKPECCRLRATCKILRDLADPIVFHHLRFRPNRNLHVTEHQILALATRSSRACELARDVKFHLTRNALRATEQSWPHFGRCEDLRVHLPSAISALTNLTCFRLIIDGYEPTWLLGSLIQTVIRLPRLNELEVKTAVACKTRIPFSLFSNLSKISVNCGSDEIVSFFVSEMATVIANSPQLRCLEVAYWGLSYGFRLRDLFGKLSPNNPLSLEQLLVTQVDSTLDQVTLPHLKKLTSISLRADVFSIARNVWRSFLSNNVKISDMTIGGVVTKETMLYLSSFSGLQNLVVRSVVPYPDMTDDEFKNTFLSEILQKHASSLQTLEFHMQWNFDPDNLTSILKCRKLRRLLVCVSEDMIVQRFLDTLADLPELKRLRIVSLWGINDISNFKPIQGLRYVEKLEVDSKLHMLERDGEQQSLRYRQID